MTKQDAGTATFRFAETNSFSDNCSAFIANLDMVDADMAVILRDNWDALVAIVRDGERDSKARSEFNSKVAAALDSFLKPDEPKKRG